MRAVKALAAAVAFLTRLPVGSRLELGAADVARGAVAFPLVGAGVGAAGAGVALLAHHRLSALLAATLAVVVVAVLTGALHLDGLADLADGLGGHTPARRLEIMRDSRLGAFGATALALALVLRIAAVQQLLLSGDALRALVAAGALSRAAAVAAAATLPYPRALGGTGSVLVGLGLRRASAAVLLGLAIAVVAYGWNGLALALAAAAAAAVVAAACRRLLGGATGDVLGGMSEVAELAALVTAAALA